jgi:hypothetical protein
MGVDLSPLTDTETIVVEEPKVEKNKLRHIINPPNNLHIWVPGMTSQDIVDVARVQGLNVKALCGAVFVPTQNPEDVKETCNMCLELAGIMMDNPPEKD